eukprot:TRINITY_DN4029_c1_g1_i1.p2 TRINITY_DN4029_c1_g1~~TRINITY_DN4029_c1_g1_i1.p2  ORF type:complete len:146 (+),score=40.69 TRINITY_DN4029_c1_g1_i1:206-643(+)
MQARDAFEACCDGKQYLDLDDLGCAVIAVFGFKFKKADLRLLYAEHAGPGDRGVSPEGFARLVADRQRLFGERDRVYRMFAALDRDGCGYLDLPTFRAALAEACRPAAARADEIFADMDTSRCGAVTLADFEEYLCGPRAEAIVG